jgi:hypothetical protein
MARLLSFPNPVNEKAARLVAAGVMVQAVVVLVTGWDWLIALMALGFLARVSTGPKLSPLGFVAAKVIAPRLGRPRWVPGPPKRFAQSIGLTVTTTAAIAALLFDADLLATCLIVLLLVFATLEATIGFCAGCWMFARLMRLGVIPATVCEECNDLTRRLRPAA